MTTINRIKFVVLVVLSFPISFGSAYIRDYFQQRFPTHSWLIEMAVGVIFALTMAYFVITPLLGLCGFPILKRRGKSP